ncbi:MAG: hypothetical protein RL637_618 [Pseudomonadota bacterium]|jgi:hypothetical protein
MKNPTEIKLLAYERLEEAEILCNAGKYDGAFYLAGYSVELMLKAKICEHWGIYNLFDSQCDIAKIEYIRKAVQIHDIRLLFIFAGLRMKLQEALFLGNRELMELYGYLIAGTGKHENCLWSEQVRYQAIGSKKPKEVIRLIELLQSERGLLKWIEQS